MRKPILSFITTTVLLAVIFFSCKKETIAEEHFFTWTVNGTNNTAALHKAFSYSMASMPIIIASTDTVLLNPDISITLGSFNTGTYTISGSGDNGVRYINASGDIFWAQTGSVVISGNAANKISGSFAVTVKNLGDVSYELSGSFINTPIEP